MERNYTFPATLTPGGDRRYLVRFPDLPEALTDGATVEEALMEAADCLTTALGSRLLHREPIPEPSPGAAGSYRIAPQPGMAMKLALNHALAARALKAADLARLMAIDHKEARRLLDPREASRLDRVSAALDRLNYAVAVTLIDRSPMQPGAPVPPRRAATDRRHNPS